MWKLLGQVHFEVGKQQAGKGFKQKLKCIIVPLFQVHLKVGQWFVCMILAMIKQFRVNQEGSLNFKACFSLSTSSQYQKWVALPPQKLNLAYKNLCLKQIQRERRGLEGPLPPVVYYVSSTTIRRASLL